MSLRESSGLLFSVKHTIGIGVDLKYLTVKVG